MTENEAKELWRALDQLRRDVTSGFHRVYAVVVGSVAVPTILGLVALLAGIGR